MSDSYKGILRYEPDTGLFRWLVKRGKTHIGQIAGCNDDLGYIKINFKTDVGKEVWRGHQLAWLIMTGFSYTGSIDHINGVRNDNRWCNLRVGTQSQNGLNFNNKISKNNASGYKGVRFENGKWRARIMVNWQMLHLGRFSTKTEAIIARRDAERRYCL